MSGTLDLLRLLVGGAFLAYAAVLDWRTRRVRNAVWLALGAIGLILWPVEAFLLDTLTWVHVAVAFLVIAAAYVLWYVHLLAGGADAKAIMALAVLAPVPAAWTALGTDLPLLTSPLPPAVVTLANAVIFFIAVPVVFFLWNLARGDVHVPTMLLGYKMSLAEAERRFVWVVDTVDEDGRLRRAVLPSKRTAKQHEANLARLRAAGHERVWVTPKVPFMIPLWAGFVAAYTVGDIVFGVVSRTLAGA